MNKSVQQHRGHGRSFSISTNQKPVFDQYFGYGMTANLQPSYLGQFNSDFDAVKSKVGLQSELSKTNLGLKNLVCFVLDTLVGSRT